MVSVYSPRPYTLSIIKEEMGGVGLAGQTMCVPHFAGPLSCTVALNNIDIDWPTREEDHHSFSYYLYTRTVLAAKQKTRIL